MLNVATSQNFLTRYLLQLAEVSSNHRCINLVYYQFALVWFGSVLVDVHPAFDFSPTTAILRVQNL